MNTNPTLWASTLFSRRDVRHCRTFRRSDNTSPTVRQKQNSNSLPLTSCAARPFPTAQTQHTHSTQHYNPSTTLPVLAPLWLSVQSLVKLMASTTFYVKKTITTIEKT